MGGGALPTLPSLLGLGLVLFLPPVCQKRLSRGFVCSSKHLARFLPLRIQVVCKSSELNG